MLATQSPFWECGGKEGADESVGYQNHNIHCSDDKILEFLDVLHDTCQCQVITST